jgi:sortase A
MSTVTAELPQRRPRRTTGRAILHWVGIACLLAAAYFGGYVAWSLWGTGLQTEQAQQDLRTTTEHWGGHPAPIPADPKTAPRILPGDAYADIVIPSIGLDMVVVQGTDYESLKKGPGHYVDTADPWDGTGRVGIAGHRTTYLAPFRRLNELDPGDHITIQMPYARFSYVVEKTKIVDATDETVLAADTAITGRKPYNRLALTACHPPFSAAQRIIVYSRLMRYKVADGRSSTG